MNLLDLIKPKLLEVSIEIVVNFKSGLVAIPTLNKTRDGLLVTCTPIQSFEINDMKALIEGLKVALKAGNRQIWSKNYDALGYKEVLRLIKCKSTKEYERDGAPLSLTRSKLNWKIQTWKRHHPRGFVPSDERDIVLPIATEIENVGSLLHELILLKKSEWYQ